MKIDFVIPWVNGNDAHWQATRNEYCENKAEIDESRYREWDILKYWFRAVEKYAPWVNRIHFVTCGQQPQWLNTDHPKLHCVNHTDFIPPEFLPTFNSMTIELNFHRIPGLSEHFVYFNDDMYLNRPVNPEDFFTHGVPNETAVMTAIEPGTPCDPHIHSICNVMAVINRHFQKRLVLKKNFSKWYTPKYGKGLVKNLLHTPGSRFSCFSLPHISSSMLKSVYEEVWALEPELLHGACKEKFRASNGVNQYLMTFYNLCKGNFVPRSADFGFCYQIGTQTQAMLRDIRTGQHKVICVNDNQDVADFAAEKAGLIAAFEAVLPEKSSFEW